jgi:protein involved in polysaccharide export with SLBB domain
MKRLFTCLFLIFSISVSFSQIDNKTNNNSSSLLSNLTISVTIGGDFPITGSFPAYINERVDQFITRMYIDARDKALRNINDPQLITQIGKKLNNYTLRGITLKRSSGEIFKLDLLKFRTDGNFRNNPYLRNDDVIIFPSDDIETNFFSVLGAVNKPGKFYFVEGDKLSDAIELAQGINKAYENVSKAEIDRLSYDGHTMTSTTVDINSDAKLQRGDRIVILADETQKKDFKVAIIGEINMPGKIPITKDKTTLKDVIQKAGGFKSDASLKRARLFNGSSLELVLEKEYGITLSNIPEYTSQIAQKTFLDYEDALMSRMSNLTEQDTSYFLMENQIRLFSPGGSVDFTKLSDTSSSDSKYIVKDGDVIIIPRKENVIYVFGQVPHPGRVSYVKGKGYEYYINASGGYGEYADNDVMVIKGSSRNWIPADDSGATLEEGDYIYVPKDPKRSFHYYLAESAKYIGIIGSIATIILLLKTL